MFVQAKYLKDLPMMTGARLTKRGRPEHWLHPIHGPLPDLIGLVTCGDSEFICAVWPLSHSFIVMLERTRDTPGQETRGTIVQSYRWVGRGDWLVSVSRGSASKDIHVGLIEEAAEDASRERIYRQLMIESVMLAAHTKIGGF